MKVKKILLWVGLIVIGAVAGFSVNNATVARFNIINSTCSVLNVAVDNHMLAPEQVRTLGQLTARKLQNSLVISAFRLDQQQINAASAGSNCSQFMAGISEKSG